MQFDMNCIHNEHMSFCFRLTSAHIQPFGLHGQIHHRVLKAVLRVKKIRLEIVIAINKLLISQIAMEITPEKRNAIPKDVVSFSHLSFMTI